MTELSIDIEKLRRRKLMVCTPMYGGQCYGPYHNSCISLTKLFDSYNIGCLLYTSPSPRD